MTADNQPISYSVQNAAAAVGISRAYLYQLIGEGKIVARKIGSRTVIPADELRRFVNSQPAFVPGEGVPA